MCFGCAHSVEAAVSVWRKSMGGEQCRCERRESGAGTLQRPDTAVCGALVRRGQHTGRTLVVRRVLERQQSCSSGVGGRWTAGVDVDGVEQGGCGRATAAGGRWRCRCAQRSSTAARRDFRLGRRSDMTSLVLMFRAAVEVTWAR